MENIKDKVYEYLKTIPKGKVVTYSQIGEFLGNKKLARVVGNVLHKNNDVKNYPCYKVVNAKGGLSKNYAFGGIVGQKKFLMQEGIEVKNNVVDLKKFQYFG